MAKRPTRASSVGLVTLSGGPMDSWHVTENAPALLAGWAEASNHGRTSGYIRDGDTAVWHDDLEPATPQQVRTVAGIMARKLGGR
jgi:hypothetical protein